jgi:hypothetical protein
MKDMVVVLINKSETGKFIARFLAKTICAAQSYAQMHPPNGIVFDLGPGTFGRLGMIPHGQVLKATQKASAMGLVGSRDSLPL